MSVPLMQRVGNGEGKGYIQLAECRRVLGRQGAKVGRANTIEAWICHGLKAASVSITVVAP